MPGLNKSRITGGTHMFKNNLNKTNLENVATMEEPPLNRMVYITKELNKNKKITSVYNVNSLETLYNGKTILKAPRTGLIIDESDIKFVSQAAYDSKQMIEDVSNSLNNVTLDNVERHKKQMNNLRKMRNNREKNGRIIGNEELYYDINNNVSTVELENNINYLNGSENIFMILRQNIYLLNRQLDMFQSDIWANRSDPQDSMEISRTLSVLLRVLASDRIIQNTLVHVNVFVAITNELKAVVDEITNELPDVPSRLMRRLRRSILEFDEFELVFDLR